MTKPDIQAVWRRYLAQRSVEDRNRLLENYLPLVKLIAARLKGKLPAGIELDDLVSGGVLGLLDALKSFDPARGVKFESYAQLRIRGAMLDGLREQDWVPRLVRKKAARLEQAGEELQRKLGREPTAKELAKELGLKVRELERMQRQTEPVGFVSLSQKWFETESFKDVQTVHMLADPKAPAPSGRLIRQDVLRLVTRSLNRNERLLVILYYLEGQTMKQIGQQIGLSESRVSQMHTQIMTRLGQQLRRAEVAA